MGLRFDLTSCEDFEELLDGPEWPITDAIINSTMSVGIGEITDENAAEFTARLDVLTVVYGPPIFRDGEPSKITLEEVRRRIGLRVNVTPETRAQFTRRIGGALVGDAYRGRGIH